MDCERRQDDVDAATIWQATIDHRTGFINSPADLRGNFLSYRGDMIIVAESYRDPLKLAVSFDVDVTRSVDHDVVDRLVEQKRTQRPVAGHVVRNIVRQLELLATRQFEPLLVGNPVDDFLNLPS